MRYPRETAESYLALVITASLQDRIRTVLDGELVSTVHNLGNGELELTLETQRKLRVRVVVEDA